MKKILIFIFVLLSSVTYAQKWQPKPWQQYVTDLKIQAAPISAPRSIIVQNVLSTEPFEKKLFRCTTSATIIDESSIVAPLKKKPGLFSNDSSSPSMLDQMREEERSRKIAAGDYHTSDFVTDMFCDILSTILFK
ncbi:hypothetical protein [Prevotella sp. HUN102]|uniref:hypothetical protein n=1 Tax=Prevotella sp. HUN102 TaxID=1392486 RepID=UPI00048AB615|nr:hypothetical protein [Prevotella sp. HUN102]